MTDSIRPHRSRKAVDYSSFGDGDGSDDDFDVPTPPLKRSKLEKKAKRNSTQPRGTVNPKKDKEAKKKKEEPPKKRDRISLEKLEEQSFERELQKVLELSKQESQGNEKTTIHIQKEKLADAENQPPVVSPNTPVYHHPQLNQNCVTNQEADIEILEEDVRDDLRDDTRSSRSRRASAPRKSFAEDQDNDSDDDFNIDDVDNGSESNFSGDDDESDYEIPKKKVVKEPKQKASKRTKETSNARKAKVSAGIKTSNSKVPTLGNKPSPSIAPTVATKRTVLPTKKIGRGFTPPATNGSIKCSVTITKENNIRKPILASPGGANPLGGVKLISPNQPRRLGLSRFARVKSLHTNLQ